jgi:hypothetical protein
MNTQNIEPSLEVIAICDTRIAAEIIKSKLDAYGIQVFIFADDDGGMFPFPFSNTVKGVIVKVLSKDFKKGKEVLKPE